jgi:hypothetical protein
MVMVSLLSGPGPELMRRETECFVALHFAPADISPQLQRYKRESK